MRKILLGIFISFGVFFLMSHNAFAVDTVINLNNYETVRSAGFPKINCKFTNGAYDATNVASCGAVPASGQATVSLQRLYTVDSYSYEPGDIIEYDLLVYSPGSHVVASPHGFISTLGSTQEYPFRVMSYKQTAKDVFYDTRIGTCTGNQGSSCTQFSGNVYYSIFHYTLLYVGPSNGSYPLGRNSGYSNMYTWSGDLEFKLVNFVQYRPSEQSQINKEQKEAADQAISDSESSSQENSSNAKTTNLIGALSGIFNTISSTSATNCNITGDLGSINMGALNLCQGKEHFNSLIEFIGFSSLFVVVFWASYHLVRRTLGLIDWARSN